VPGVLQTLGLDPVHTPDWQALAPVQAFWSLQAVPFDFAGLEHAPVVVLQVPALWHWSEAVQVLGFVPVQVPD